MGPVARVVERIVSSGMSLRPAQVRAAAAAIAVDEAPLEPDVARRAVEELVGLGPIEPLLSDPAVTDVLVNGPDDVWVERSGKLERTAVSFSSAQSVVAAVERVIAPLGLRLDRASPAVDARLPDGSRLHAIVPPASVDGPVMAIRRFRPSVRTIEELVSLGAIASDGAGILIEAVGSRANVLVSGGTGTGKTTLLNVLAAVIPAGERLVTVEDAAELQLPGHVVRLEGHPPNAEGAGEITLHTLVRHALRLRPDRIVVGEVRGAEALDLVQAMSTGHAGSMGTVHANGPSEALWRIETLALSGDARVSPESIRRLLRSSVDLVVHLERGPAGLRRVSRIVEVSVGESQEVWSW